MGLVEELLARNEQFAEHFEEGGRSAVPIQHLAVLTCMDARVLAPRFLGLGVGDAHVIRNAGGRASDDAIRSLILSSRLLQTREFFVIQHTDCGMLHVTNEDMRAFFLGAMSQRAAMATRLLLSGGVSNEIFSVVGVATPFVFRDLGIRK